MCDLSGRNKFGRKGGDTVLERIPVREGGWCNTRGIMGLLRWGRFRLRTGGVSQVEPKGLSAGRLQTRLEGHGVGGGKSSGGESRRVRGV